MTSTRLPGKVLMDLAGRPMLVQQLRRLKRCKMMDELIVATTVNRSDDPVVQVANDEGVPSYRGDEQDVLSRFVEAACETSADIVVRITADCPLIDPGISDTVIQALVERQDSCDYASNTIDRTYPIGLDTEAMYRDTLERIHRLAQSSSAREHVTSYLLEERPEIFLTHSVQDSEQNADLRWTVDTLEDLKMVRRLYEELELGERILEYSEILAHVRANPALSAMNSTEAR